MPATILAFPSSQSIRAFELKGDERLLIQDAVLQLVSTEKMDGRQPTFISGGPRDNTAVAIKLTFEGDHPSMVIHPQQEVFLVG